MKLVVDTSILIDHLQGGIRWEKFLASLREEIELYIPTIVIFELFSGKSTREIKAYQRITDMIQYLRTVELNSDIAKRAGQIYRDVSQTLQVPDYIIAASALEIGGAVVTLNRKHFEQIPELNLYDT